MQRIILGKSGLSVSPLAFGTWQLSPRFWGEQSKVEAMSAMRRAFELGINFFDTADAYGDGYAETVLGEVVSELPRDELVLATKVFNHYNPDASRYPDLSPDHIVERCEASLKRLKTDFIDLYILHFFDQLTPMADVAGTMEKLVEQGKVRALGVSNHTLEQLKSQRVFGNYTVIQPPYSLLDPAIENDLLPYCQAENIGVMVYSPMHKGLLTGKYKGDEKFDDFRKLHPDFQGERFRTICENVQSLEPMAKKYNLTIYQLVLAAVLMHPSINVAVCGIKTPDQIASAAGAAGVELSRPDYFEVRKIIAGAQATRITDASGTKK